MDGSGEASERRCEARTVVARKNLINMTASAVDSFGKTLVSAAAGQSDGAILQCGQLDHKLILVLNAESIAEHDNEAAEARAAVE